MFHKANPADLRTKSATTKDVVHSVRKPSKVRFLAKKGLSFVLSLCMILSLAGGITLFTSEKTSKAA